MPVSCSTKVLGRDARRGPAAPIRVSDSGGSEGVGGGLYGVRTWGGGRGDLVNGSGWHLCVLCVWWVGARGAEWRVPSVRVVDIGLGFGCLSDDASAARFRCRFGDHPCRSGDMWYGVGREEADAGWSMSRERCFDRHPRLQSEPFAEGL